MFAAPLELASVESEFIVLVLFTLSEHSKAVFLGHLRHCCTDPGPLPGVTETYGAIDSLELTKCALCVPSCWRATHARNQTRCNARYTLLIDVRLGLKPSIPRITAIGTDLHVLVPMLCKEEPSDIDIAAVRWYMSC